AEERRRIEGRRGELALGDAAAQVHADLGELFHAGADRLGQGREVLVLRGARARGADLGQPLLHGGAAVARDLPEEEVLRLDPVRALVDAGDAAVADELLDEELAAVAVAAEDLHGR